MSKVDWSLAPEGATHYGIVTSNRICWYAVKSEFRYDYAYQSEGFNAEKWTPSSGKPEHRPLIARPQPKPWSGPEDGLPPVNERVEVLWSSITGEYVDALILAHDEDRAVFRFVTGDRKGEYQADKLHFSGKFPNFRAIKTQKQIADEKRENAIREFMDVVGIDCRVTAARLVDAGFKREVV